VYDTRNNTQGDLSVPVGRRQTVSQTVAGIGVPANDSAVAVTITAVVPTQAELLTVWPSGSSGKLDIYNHNGQVEIVFDLVATSPRQRADYHAS
jgi:hypothetical protein